MESLGEYLKRERELRNLSMEDVAKYTRYHLDKIRALERDEHRHLPPPPYVKGMLRSIAKYLGMDAADVLFRYEEFLKTKNDVIHPVLETKEIPELPFYHQRNFLLVSATVSFLILVVVVSLFFRESKKIEPISVVPSLPQTASSEEDGVVSGVSGKYKLVMVSSKDVWFKIQVDSEAPYSMSLKAGGSSQIDGKKVIRVFASDAEGLKLTFNGKEVVHSLQGARTFIFPPASDLDKK